MLHSSHLVHRTCRGYTFSNTRTHLTVTCPTLRRLNYFLIGLGYAPVVEVSPGKFCSVYHSPALVEADALPYHSASYPLGN